MSLSTGHSMQHIKDQTVMMQHMDTLKSKQGDLNEFTNGTKDKSNIFLTTQMYFKHYFIKMLLNLLTGRKEGKCVRYYTSKL